MVNNRIMQKCTEWGASWRAHFTGYYYCDQIKEGWDGWNIVARMEEMMNAYKDLSENFK